MGWISVVGVCQHLHRGLLLTSVPRGAELPPLRGAREDRPFPGSGDCSQLSSWQTYIDNFDRGLVIALCHPTEVKDLSNAEAKVLLRSRPEAARDRLDEVVGWQEAARHAYNTW